MPLMNDTNSPTDMGSQVGKASKIGFLAEKMIGGMAKRKKFKQGQTLQGRRSLTQQAMGQQQMLGQRTRLQQGQKDVALRGRDPAQRIQSTQGQRSSIVQALQSRRQMGKRKMSQQQSLSKQALGQSPLSKDLIGR